MLSTSDNWGPFHPALSHAERVARLRTLRAFAQVWHGKHNPLVKALWLAESGEPEDLEAARIEMDRVPARIRRNILGSWAEHYSYKADGKTPPKTLEGAG